MLVDSYLQISKALEMASTLHGSSDPVSYICNCPAKDTGGKVLLFYRYWQNTPVLQEEHSPKTENPQDLVQFHQELASRLQLGGKFRIAREGFNITLGGTDDAIAEYMRECSDHWSFSGLELEGEENRNAFFKPTSGCACAFGGKASVKATAEITPLGITNYSPSSWSKVIPLSPEEFHEMCLEGSMQLIDVRNHYESRIGYFVTGDGDVAVRPAVRRFSQWPEYVARHVLGNELYKRPIATYCTGGIRCEKGARWMQEALASQGGHDDAPVYTLHGGIVAYQAWMQKEVEAGRKQAGDSFFKGKNYVFDARGAIGMDGEDALYGEPVSACHVCNKAESRLGKCEGKGCHLVLVVCEACENKGGVRCCVDCRQIDLEQTTSAQPQRRRICQCEQDREKSLWGDQGAKLKVRSRVKTLQQ